MTHESPLSTLIFSSRVHSQNSHLALQVKEFGVPPYISLPPAEPGSAEDAAVPHLPLMTAHLLHQVFTGLLIASDQEHSMLIVHIALPEQSQDLLALNSEATHQTYGIVAIQIRFVACG
jgi:hypothetical protein